MMAPGLDQPEMREPQTRDLGDDRYNVEAVERFVRICALFSTERPALSSREIAELIGIPLRTTIKLLATLTERDLLARDGQADCYRLGFGWLRFGAAPRMPIDIRRAAAPIMRALRDQTNETVILAVRIGDMRVNVDYVESRHTLRRVTHRGSETPLHVGAGGRTLLAGLPDDEVAAYLARTKLVNIGYNTPTDPERIWADIHITRAQGYFILTNEISEGGASVSVPLKDYSGETLGTLTVGGPLFRFDDKARQEAVPLLMNAASKFLYDVEHDR
ncbi:MAG TPA: IclR family transcriptional regulator [Stellaceae bacterium]|nr:IclR family transcriptional regulator [Stellaceae bacterium]